MPRFRRRLLALFTIGVLGVFPAVSPVGVFVGPAYAVVTSGSGTLTTSSCSNPARGEGFYGDIYRVSVAGSYTFTMRGQATNEGTIRDPFIQVVGADRSTIRAQDDDSGVQLNALLSNANVALDEFVIFTTFSAETGSYTWSADGPGTLSKVSSCPQAITFSGPSSQTYGTPLTVQASSSSGLNVVMTSKTTSICQVASSAPPSFAVSLIGVGSCTLEATQAGNSNNTAALPVSRTFSIGARPLSVTGLTASKEYDGTVSAPLSGTATLSGVAAGDNISHVSLAGTPAGVFSSATAGVGKPVTLSGISLSGTKANNYTLATTISGTISKKALTAVMAGTATKVYDGTTSVPLSSGLFTITGAITGDSVSISNVSGVLDSANAGPRSVTIQAPTLSGASSANYSLAGPITGQAVVEKASQASLSVTSAASLPFSGALSLSASGGSGSGALTFSVSGANAAGCTIENGTLSANGAAGTSCNILATRAADNNFIVETSPPMVVAVVQAAQSSEPLISSPVILPFKSELLLEGSGGDGDGPLSFVTSTAGCSIDPASNILTTTGIVGSSCSVTVTRGASTDGNFAPRTGSATTITVGKGVIAADPLPNLDLQVGGTASTLSSLQAFAADGSPVDGNLTWVSSDPIIASVIDGVVTPLAAGTVSLTGTFTPSDAADYDTLTTVISVLVRNPSPPPVAILPPVTTTETTTTPPSRMPTPRLSLLNNLPTGRSGPIGSPSLSRGTQLVIGGVLSTLTKSDTPDGGLLMRAGTLELALSPNNRGTVGPGNVLQRPGDLSLGSGSDTAIGGKGLLPNSMLQVWLVGSDSRELAKIPVSETGAFDGTISFAVPNDSRPLPIGRQILQVAGLDEQGQSTVFDVEITVAQPPVVPEINRSSGALPALGIGQSLGLSGGFPEEMTVLPLVDQGGVVVAGQSWGMSVLVPGLEGESLKFVHSGTAVVEGDGFMPGTTASIWFFSNPTLMGSAVVNDEGRFVVEFVVDASFIPDGAHTLQMQGVGNDGYVKSANVGVAVDQAAVSTADEAQLWTYGGVAVMALVLAVAVVFLFLARKRIHRKTL